MELEKFKLLKSSNISRLGNLKAQCNYKILLLKSAQAESYIHFCTIALEKGINLSLASASKLTVNLQKLAKSFTHYFLLLLLPLRCLLSLKFSMSSFFIMCSKCFSYLFVIVNNSFFVVSTFNKNLTFKLQILERV